MTYAKSKTTQSDFVTAWWEKIDRKVQRLLENDYPGVAIAGQPIARKLDDGLTIEVRRLCTDGTKDACSKLYGACARVLPGPGLPAHHL